MRASGCNADFERELAHKAKRAIASLWRNLRWRRSRALPPRRSLISLAQHAEGYSEADRHCNATCNRGDVSRPAVGGELSIRQRRPAPKKKEAISISSRSRSSTQCHDTLPQHFRDQGVAFELTKRSLPSTRKDVRRLGDRYERLFFGCSRPSRRMGSANICANRLR